MRVKRACLVDKGQTSYEPIPLPELLSEDFRELHSRLSDAAEGVTEHDGLEQKHGELLKCDLYQPTSSRIGSWVSVTNVQANFDVSKKSVEEETTACFQILQSECPSQIISTYHITSL